MRFLGDFPLSYPANEIPGYADSLHQHWHSPNRSTIQSATILRLVGHRQLKGSMTLELSSRAKARDLSFAELFVATEAAVDTFHRGISGSRSTSRRKNAKSTKAKRSGLQLFEV